MTFVSSKGLGPKRQASSLVTGELLTLETYQEAQMSELQRHFVLVIICQHMSCPPRLNLKNAEQCQSNFKRKSPRLVVNSAVMNLDCDVKLKRKKNVQFILIYVIVLIYKKHFYEWNCAAHSV